MLPVLRRARQIPRCIAQFSEFCLVNSSEQIFRENKCRSIPKMSAESWGESERISIEWLIPSESSYWFSSVFWNVTRYVSLPKLLNKTNENAKEWNWNLVISGEFTNPWAVKVKYRQASYYSYGKWEYKSQLGDDTWTGWVILTHLLEERNGRYHI